MHTAYFAAQNEPISSPAKVENRPKNPNFQSLTYRYHNRTTEKDTSKSC